MVFYYKYNCYKKIFIFIDIYGKTHNHIKILAVNEERPIKFVKTKGYYFLNPDADWINLNANLEINASELIIRNWEQSVTWLIKSAITK